ncbi:cisplatin damage response ATP-dependent DNA ligase, partial [Rhizobiaceae bacterium]|nr:cisplatin damage response ATP-dependent DNA ligase [Rhizobiaceae bacterium]
MKPFATLLDRLTLTPSRNAKIRLMVDYFAAVPDPDRGWGLAAITRDLDIPSVKPAMLRGLMAERMDAELFAMSHDYVGDLAETIALVWDSDLRTSGIVAPPRSKGETPNIDPDTGEVLDKTPTHGRNSPLTLDEVVTRLHRLPKTEALRQVAEWLDMLDSAGRYALLKLMTGGMRIGVSARLAKQALAAFSERSGNLVDIVEIEELWHGLEPPYEDLFAWLTGKAEKPTHRAAAPFRPVMLATPLADTDMTKLDPSEYAAEWKWDGIRVQATAEGDTRRIYSRTGDDIGGSFPDLLDAMDYHGSLDGELLVGRAMDSEIDVGSFSELQQRLNRKTVGKKLLASHPVFLRVYDLLAEGDEN